MTFRRLGTAYFLLFAGIAAAQNKKPAAPVQAQSNSTISSSVKDGQQTIDIRNVAYEVTGSQVPGRPRDERLVLRKTTQIKEVVDEIGMEATTTYEAWPLGADLKGKPVYKISISGLDGKTIESTLIEITRGLEDTQWWSIYKIGTGQHLFDTYVPMLKFSLSRGVQTMRYTGIEVPPDDATDKRLTEAHIVAVISYASEDRVLREALITCDDPKRARLLRSYADEDRALTLLQGKVKPGNGKIPGDPALTLNFSISQSFPSPPDTISVLIPVLDSDLDLAHAQLPAGLHIAAWKR